MQKEKPAEEVKPAAAPEQPQRRKFTMKRNLSVPALDALKQVLCMSMFARMPVIKPMRRPAEPCVCTRRTFVYSSTAQRDLHLSRTWPASIHAFIALVKQTS
jgi:hypothetical protein